ncbi:MAG: TonB-dependent receptor, partial [Bacteroidetes bacterium]|nr:TonB-dependent receptor [Bacteroidota bacterium]
MIKSNLLTVFLLAITTLVMGQSEFKARVLDGSSREPLVGATAVLKGTTNGATTDLEGNVTVAKIPNDQQILVISSIGYQTVELTLQFPLLQKEPHIILLAVAELELDEVIIEATRANKSVANLPTRTEVLTEEIDEAASMEPSRIAHLITHSTGIQVQTTSATSNGAVVRIQGLNGRYTQILKDGFPLYGGFSGSLDVLQIPPLDLRQVEYIKGSASTLYGGGA